MVIDIDISRKILLQYGSEDAVISRYLKKQRMQDKKSIPF
jgi:hypothetical protein